MTVSPSLDAIFGVMAAVSFGQTEARVLVPEDPRVDDVPTRFAIALNALLDDLSSRAKAATLMAARLRSWLTQHAISRLLRKNPSASSTRSRSG